MLTIPNFRNVEIESSKLLSALSMVAGYGLVGDRDQGYDVNEEANEVDIRVVTKKRTMDFLGLINRSSRVNGVFDFVAL